jgi:hypothetical protein
VTSGAANPCVGASTISKQVTLEKPSAHSLNVMLKSRLRPLEPIFSESTEKINA